MDLDLEGRRFLVTGGSSGLGLALAGVLLDEGAHVAICGRDRDRLSAAVDSLGDRRTEVLTFATDVTDSSAVSTMFSDLADRWTSLDGLVNNAGINSSAPFTELTDERWYRDFDLKVMAMVRGVRAALPLLRRSDAPSVLTILSTFARFQTSGAMPSSVLRAAGLSATNALARDLAPDGIRVNAVLTGVISSGQWEATALRTGARDGDDAAGRAAALLGVPLGRAGNADELASAAAFLLSPRAGYITGAGLNVDGGLSPVP